jgi:hypothetical protein
MWVMFCEDDWRGAIACGEVKADGSFRMQPWGEFEHYGVKPGTYRVYVIGHPTGTRESPVASKYQAAETSDVLVHVGPSWDDFALSLPAAGRGPTLARHR